MPIEALRNKAIAELAAFFVPEGVECLVYVQDGERPSDTRYFVGYERGDGDVEELAVSKASTIEAALPKLYDVLANKLLARTMKQIKALGKCRSLYGMAAGSHALRDQLLDAAKRCLPRKQGDIAVVRKKTAAGPSKGR